MGPRAAIRKCCLFCSAANRVSYARPLNVFIASALSCPQVSQVCYGLFMACDVGYSTYLFAAMPKSDNSVGEGQRYRRAASLVKVASLTGRVGAAVAGQFVFSLCKDSVEDLHIFSMTGRYQKQNRSPNIRRVSQYPPGPISIIPAGPVNTCRGYEPVPSPRLLSRATQVDYAAQSKGSDRKPLFGFIYM